MSYVLAARCRDGVCFVSDKKIVRVGYGSENGEKIHILKDYGVVIGAVGDVNVKNYFLNRLEEILKKKNGNLSQFRFKNLCEDLARKSVKRYKRRDRDVEMELIVAMRSDEWKRKVYRIFDDGSSSAISGFYETIGTGSDHGLHYLKGIININSTMKNAAVVLSFIPYFIQHDKLDMGVGGEVDIVYVPSNLERKIEFLKRSEIKKIESERDDVFKDEFNRMNNLKISIHSNSS